MAKWCLFVLSCALAVVSGEGLVPIGHRLGATPRNAPVVKMSGGGAVAPQQGPRPGPAGVYDAAMGMGAAKAALPTDKLLTLGFLSGAHIALGAFLMVSCGGSIPSIKDSAPGVQRMISGLMGLPMGLLMVLGGGGELATGNFALVTAAWANGKAKLKDLIKNWSVVFFGNFLGSIAVACIAAVANTGVAAGAAAIAAGKMSTPFAAAFCKGILCNWLVSMAVYMSIAHKDLASKAAAVIFPISGFVALGLEHSVANMFLVPFAMMVSDTSFTFVDFLVKNLIPVTLGNIVGGALFVGLAYWNAYGTNKK